MKMMRRVISDSEDVDTNVDMRPSVAVTNVLIENENYDVTRRDQLPSATQLTSRCSEHQATVVVDDQHMEETENTPAAFQMSKSSLGGSSDSLSDVSTESKDNKKVADSEVTKVRRDAAKDSQDIPASVGLYSNAGALRRSDSGNSNDNNSIGSAHGSQSSSRDWGWFDETHYSTDGIYLQPDSHRRKADSHKNSYNDRKPRGRGGLLPHVWSDPTLPVFLDNDAPAMAVTAPNYVFEESLSSQRLWKDTAGQRPPQPVEERAFFEKMWAQNFARSQVNYQMPVEVLTATSPISLSPFADGNTYNGCSPQTSEYNLVQVAPATRDQRGGNVAEEALLYRMNDPTRSNVTQSHAHNKVNQRVKGSSSDGDLVVLVRDDNCFGTTVSKSFAVSSDNGGPIPSVAVSISIASYRVVESTKYGKYAQFLIIYREGSFHDTVGVWKRYSDFVELSRKVTQAHEGCASVLANISPLSITDEPEFEHLPNAITSWRLLKKRQRWYRCFDSGYLSLKVFLLERFLHDILFESSSPKLLRDFVGAESIESSE